ncbi:glycosyltransferase family 2 protein [Pseudomonas aeruginosa]|uniref:glycosyltransferase family 2 protein n=1 Tax=Pseudomonas aeruginosa TaxID=287 RepID=UPI00406CAE58
MVIPCFNHGRYLRRALDSLARQSFQDFEIILVDDGSDDPSTLSLLEALQEPGMTILRQPNRGPIRRAECRCGAGEGALYLLPGCG